MQATGREALGVEVEVAAHVVGEADGVGLVVDGERRADAEHRRFPPQDPRARRVERGHPHPVRDRTDQLGDAFLHLARGLVRERDREQPERRDALLLDEVGDAMREHTRLARAGAGDDEERPVGCRRGFALDRVQAREQLLRRRRRPEGRRRERRGIEHLAIVRVFGRVNQCVRATIRARRWDRDRRPAPATPAATACGRRSSATVNEPDRSISSAKYGCHSCSSGSDVGSMPFGIRQYRIRSVSNSQVLWVESIRCTERPYP